LEGLQDYPGLEGLILGGFGSGNLPAHEIPALKKILSRGIPALVITTCLKGHTILSLSGAGRKVSDAGAREGFVLTAAAALQKIMYALGRVGMEQPGFTGHKRMDAVYRLLVEPVGCDLDKSLLPLV
jgi:L-asparaginase/Glu-tRNA(Gln) amidotransferase subunit D